jgi:hypothetical protein
MTEFSRRLRAVTIEGSGYDLCEAVRQAADVIDELAASLTETTLTLAGGPNHRGATIDRARAALAKVYGRWTDLKDLATRSSRRSRNSSATPSCGA